MQISGFASRLKRSILPPGAQPRVVPFGLYRGLTLNLDLGYQAQVYFGLWERETYAAIRKMTKGIAWAVDVGAGRGELCLYLLRNACPTVYAFEPDQSEAAELRKNIAINRPKYSPHIIQRFVGSVHDRLDDLPLDRAKRGFVKIDVEGAEIDVLLSARSLLIAARPAILVEIHSADLEGACIALLQGFQYKVHIIRNAWWRAIIPENRPLPHNRWLIATRNDKSPQAPKDR